MNIDLAVKTDKGRWLVKIGNYGCYTDSEGSLVRSVDDINKEIAWAEENWENYKPEEFPEELKPILEGSIKYTADYQNSLVPTED